jgi:hypothetical protein
LTVSSAEIFFFSSVSRFLVCVSEYNFVSRLPGIS